MVDLPKIPRRLVTTEPPKPSLTRGDLMAPYAALSEGMEAVGKAASDFAEERAEDAAARAVQTGPDGQITVERGPIPMVGAAGRRFERAIRVGAVAAADASSDRALIDLRAESKGDPEGFLRAAEAYRDKRIADDTPVLGPAGAQALRRQIDNRITQTYSGLTVEHQNKQLVQADRDIVARITSQADEMETLARRGGIGADFQDRMGNIRMLLEERVNAPNSTFSRAQADLFMDQLNTRVQGAAIHEQTERVYRESGYENAREFLRASVRELDGKVKELDKIERTGMAWLRSEEAGMRADRDAIGREWATAKSQIATLDRETLLDIERRASEVGNTRVAGDVAQHRAALDIVAPIRNLPVQDQVALARSGGPEIDRAIDGAAARHGVDKNAMRLFARIESGFNPRNQKGKYKGLFQMSDEEFARYGGGDIFNPVDNANAAARKLAAETARFQSTYGRAPEAWELYLTHQQGEGGFAAHQANPSAPAWQNMAGTREGRDKGERWAKQAIWGNIPDREKQRFGSVENVTSQEFMDIWKARAGGGSVASELTQGRSGLLARGMLLRDLNRDFTSRLDAVNDRVKRGEIPEASEISDLVALGSVSTNPQHRRRVAELAAMAEGGAAFQRLNGPERDAAVSAMETRLRSGAATQLDSDLTAGLRKANETIDTAYRQDPYGAYYRFGQGDAAQALPPIDFTNPQQAAAVLDLKVKQQSVFREQEGLGPVSVLRPAEAEAFRGTLATGDARTVANAFGLLNRLPDDVLAATLKDEKVKAGIVAATHTTDPAKFNAVMSALDTMYRRDPVGFSARFGPEAFNTLADWQAKLRYMSPEELAEDRRKALDPQQAEQRRRNIEQGQKLARTKTVDQVVADLGTAWWLTPGVVARNVTGSQGLPPEDEGTRQALMGDYESVFERRYAATLDKDQAHQQTLEQLRTKWGRSELNGGRLMVRAPETVYPAVDGSHDWMRPQIEADIAKQLGVPSRDVVPSFAPGTGGVGQSVTRNWDYILVPDAKTESAAQRYDRHLPASETNPAPTYQVIVRDNRRVTPRWEPLRNASGQPLRMGFDPNTATDAARLRFEQQQGKWSVPRPSGGGGF